MIRCMGMVMGMLMLMLVVMGMLVLMLARWVSSRR